MVDAIGDGRIGDPDTGAAEVTSQMKITTDIEEWIRFVYPQYQNGKLSTEDGALLTLRNLVVDDLNCQICKYLLSLKNILYSVDGLSRGNCRLKNFYLTFDRNEKYI